MAVRSIHQLVLDEALDVLDELGAWLRLAQPCPKCEAPQGCSHEARCPLARVARLRCLLGSGDQRCRDVELAALRRERSESAASTGATIHPPPPLNPDASASMTSDRSATPPAREREQTVDAQLEAVDDEQARAYVVEVLEVAATRCFAEASALRERAQRTVASAIDMKAAALFDRTGRYAEAAAGWLLRNGANALLGQGALLGAFVRVAAPPAAESEGSPR